MNTRQQVRCYAVRRLNPFFGVLQVVETPTGRATNTNGLVWHIEVLSEKPADWGSLGSDVVDKAWFLYGLWTEEDGLVDSPLAAQSLGQRACKDAEYLYQALRINREQLPFALADRRELWLLDAVQQKPLDLLFAMLPDATPPRPQPRYWRGCLGRKGLPGQRRFPHIDRLEMQIRKRAGFNVKWLWVTWDPEHMTVETDGGKEMRVDEFPVYGISEDWSDKADLELVQRYIDWTAPSLLTLPYLEDSRRSRLESWLTEQAISVEHHWRLYPKILDESKLTAARVQAKLQSVGESTP